jgi:hypothetical protein
MAMTVVASVNHRHGWYYQIATLANVVIVLVPAGDKTSATEFVAIIRIHVFSKNTMQIRSS